MTETIPLHELRARLAERRRLVRARTTRHAGQVRALDEARAIEGEEESQEQNLSRSLAGLDDRDVAELEAIDRAVARMDDGTYGACARCGAPIGVARLRAVPTATECMRCAGAPARAAE